MESLDHQTLCRQIVDLAPDAIMFADRQGIIRLWNQGAQRIFGFSAAQALGQSLDLIIPEKLRVRHWQGYHKTMASGETRYGTALLAVPAMRQGGERLSSEFSIVMLKDAAGHPLGVAAILRDVSERQQREKQLREQLASCQRTGAAPGGDGRQA